MFSRIRIKNYKSIDDLTIDFSYAEGKAPNGYKESNILPFLEPTKNNNDRKIPVLAIYGANASGKSNLIDCFFVFAMIVMNGFEKKYFNPNKLRKTIKNETIIEAEFIINSKKISYLLGYNHNSITQEIFKSEEKTFFEVKNQKLIINSSIETKMYKEEHFEEVFKTACLETENNNTLQINTFLNSIVDKLPGLNEYLTQAVNYIKTCLMIGKRNYMEPMESARLLSKATKNSELQDSFNSILRIMQKLNIDIYKLELFKVEKKNKFFHNNFPSITFNITSYHKNEMGELIPFDFETDESDGTIRAFGLIGVILKTLLVGGVLIVDEIDNSLHPLILVPLIKMFKDKNINKNNAQLIFTSHTTEILEDEDFRVSEFLFMNKSEKKGTFAKRLSDFEKARNDVKFRKRYLKGFYLGIPYPTL